MKKADFINNVWANLTIVNGDKAATQIPYGIGDIHRFSWRYDMLQQRSEIIDGRRCTWIDVLTDDGYGISYNQLCRKDNGLNLDGQTSRERLDSFLDILKSSEHITLKVVNVLEHKFIWKDGTHHVSKYLAFERI